VQGAEDAVHVWKQTGGGETLPNLFYGRVPKDFRDQTGATEFHLSAKEAIESKMIYRKQDIYMGSLPQIPEYTIDRTSADVVRNMVTLVNEE
jgi:copper homeostasis protein CutC